MEGLFNVQFSNGYMFNIYLCFDFSVSPICMISHTHDYLPTIKINKSNTFSSLAGAGVKCTSLPTFNLSLKAASFLSISCSTSVGTVYGAEVPRPGHNKIMMRFRKA